MTNSKHTKKALFSSIVSLLLCFTMLMGATFAWFTDNVSSTGNVIQAGDLEVDIVDAADTTISLAGDNLKFQNKNGDSNILWEPGVTFRTQAFKIKNAGNLALKYRIALNGIDGSAKLLEVISFSVVDANGTAVDLATFEGRLDETDDCSEALYIQGVMDTAAGNEYENEVLEGIGITVTAGQQMHEEDSFDDTYDAEATYPAGGSQPQAPTFTVSTAAQLQAAMTPTVSNDELIVNLSDDIELAAGETWTPLNLEAYSGNVLNIVINGNGHSIKGLDAPLIGKAFFGNTSIEINDLTLVDSNINSSGDYVGAFAAYADNCASVTLSNCHLREATIVGANDAAALVGFCSSNVTIEDCSVIDCEITGGGNVGSLIAMLSVGQGSEVANVSDVTVTGNTLVSTKVGSYRIGELIGTTNMPTLNLTNITASGNSCTQTNSTGVASGMTATAWIGRNTGATTVTGDTSASIN
ncbi:MAG: SipW-dependent-type signal peptide-containing protein [Oscillospiraceae bacterium]|nr:SipW-dependent-type signal peptide-containing protein [Oscillospiraceae bacterium]